MLYDLTMARAIYKFIDGECVQVGGDTLKSKESESPFVHQDTLKQPLRHPKTDEMVDSLSRWNAINKEHKLECVGNDLLSRRKDNFKEKITDARFNDAYEEAYNIETDPFKRNQRVNRQREEVEKFYKAQNGKRAPAITARELAQMMGIDK